MGITAQRRWKAARAARAEHQAPPVAPPPPVKPKAAPPVVAEPADHVTQTKVEPDPQNRPMSRRDRRALARAHG